jgi:tRNA (adenine57-N1/adenine58-N1)-methyltransferase
MDELRAGDMVLLVEAGGKRRLITLQEGQSFHSHKGTIHHNDMIGKPPGRIVYTQLGHPYLVLRPGLYDFIQNAKRVTQIIYPKDAAYIVLRLDLRDGKRVLEAGTGSGGLTMALASAVMPSGRVVSCETQEDAHRIARRNLRISGLEAYVELKLAALSSECAQGKFDAVFLDMKEPWSYLGLVEEALVDGGHFGSLLPTTNQVSALLEELDRRNFMDVAVEELLLRPYKPVASRLRPADRMVAHSGYLIFARRVEADDRARVMFSPIRRMHREKWLGEKKDESNE